MPTHHETILAQSNNYRIVFLDFLIVLSLRFKFDSDMSPSQQSPVVRGKESKPMQILSPSKAKIGFVCCSSNQIDTPFPLQ
jgi:hypothetical protein